MPGSHTPSMLPDIDEIHLVLLALYDYADDYGVSPAQARIMLREAVELAGDIADADADETSQMLADVLAKKTTH